MLEKYGVLLYEEHMSEHLLDKIMSPNTELNTGVTISPSQYIYRDTTWYYWLCHYQVRFLVDDRYDSQELVIYWGFKDIKEWCQLKPRSLQAAVGYPMDTGR